MMKLLPLLLFSFPAFANESGVLFQGKTYVIYKDGKKVGDEPKVDRKIASIDSSGYLRIRYETDETNGTICYYNYDASTSVTAVSCLKR